MRVDADGFFSTISIEIDGERITAPRWVDAPGWRGEDVRVGKSYSELLRSDFGVESIEELARTNPEGLMRLWNSDNHTTPYPFDKPHLAEAKQEWEAIARKSISFGNPTAPEPSATEGQSSMKRKGVAGPSGRSLKSRKKKKRVRKEEVPEEEV